jgi:hypothetical protein
MTSMKVIKINTEQEYHEIAAKIEAIQNAEPGTSKALLLKFLINSIVQHERERKTKILAMLA